MENKKCPKCGGMLKQINEFKWICSNNFCDYVFIENYKPWYFLLSENEEYWDEDIIENSPCVVAYEWYSLREMLHKGEISGLEIKVKDVFEVILKFSVLIILTDDFQTKNTILNKYKKKRKNAHSKRVSNLLYTDVLVDLICSLPSLGDWQDSAEKILKIKAGCSNPDILLLKNILKIYKNNKIVHWRNEKIGHGAFNETESREFISDLKDKINLLHSFFLQNKEYYKNIQIYVKKDNKKIPLRGYKYARNLGYSGQGLYIIKGSEESTLMPLIQNIDGGIYFFDSYLSKKKKTNYLNYIAGKKTSINDVKINELYKKLNKVVNAISGDISAEDKIFIKEKADSIDRVLRPDYLIKFPFVTEAIKKFISHHNKGVFLLQMESGMGKTTFVKMMDFCAYHAVKTKNNEMWRAFYINPVYSYSPLSFIHGITDALCYIKKDNTLTGEIPIVDINSPKAKEQFADLINQIFKRQQKNADIDKLFICIDGIDEIPITKKKTILDLIPPKDKLEQGVYFIVTCRTDAQLSEFNKSLLEKIHVDQKLVVDSSDTEYHQMMVREVKTRLNVEDTISNKLVAVAQNRIMYLNLAIKYYLLNQDILNDTPIKFIGNYLLEILHQLYGDMYFNEIFKLACTLSYMQIPLDIKTLSLLIGEDTIKFKTISYLGELRPILNITRNPTNTLISITRQEYIDELKKYTEINNILEHRWLDELRSIDDDKKNRTSDDILRSVIIFTAVWNNNKGKLATIIRSRSFDYFLDEVGELANSYNKSANEYQYMIFHRFFTIINPIIIYTHDKSLPFNQWKLLEISYEMAKIFTNKGEFELIINVLRKNLQLVKKYKIDTGKMNLLDTYVFLGSTYESIDKQEQALNCFKEVEKITKQKYSAISDEIGQTRTFVPEKFINDFNANCSKAILYKNRSQEMNAIALLEQTEFEIGLAKYRFNLTPKQVFVFKFPLYKIYGNIYKRTDPQKALQYFKKIEEGFSKYDMKDYTSQLPDIFLNYGQTYRVLKDYDNALYYYHCGLDLLKVNSINGKVTNSTMTFNLYQSMGNVYRDLNKPAEAVKYYTNAINVANKIGRIGGTINNTALSGCYISRSEEYEKLGMLNESQKDKENSKAIPINMDKVVHSSNLQGKDYAKFLYDAAQENERKKQFDLALDKLFKAESIEPKKPQYLMDISYCFGESGKPEKAAEYLNYFLIYNGSLDIKNVMYCKNAQKILDDKEITRELFNIVQLHVYNFYVYYQRTKEYDKVIVHFEYGFFVYKKFFVVDILPIEALSKNGQMRGFEEKDRDDIVNNFYKKILKQSKYRQDMNMAEKLYNLAIRYLNDEVSTTEKLNGYFRQSLSEATKDELLELSKQYTNAMIALDLLFQAVSYGKKSAILEIAHMYRHEEFLGGNRKWFVPYEHQYLKNMQNS